MRWNFIESSNETEVAYKRQKQAAISTWWKSFEGQAETLFQAGKKHDLDSIVDWVDEHLHKVHPDLMWDVTVDDKECLFVITPESSHELRPLVETMVQSAPTIPKWRFGTYREPHAATVGEIGDTRITSDISDLHFLAHSRTFNIIDVVFMSSHFKRDDEQNDLGSCFVICELLLGEELLDKRIGMIETRSYHRPLQEKIVNLFGRTKHNPTEGGRPGDELLECVSSLKDEMVKALPDTPFYKTKFEEFTGIFVQPSDNALPSRFTFSTALPDVISSINNRFLFHSERFSKLGEKFCYLKLADMEEIRSSVEKRGAVEDTIDAALRQAHVGCVFGGGAGQECAFIDLILADVEKAIPIIRQIAQTEQFSDRSWLLFHDTPWIAEWVGLTASSPVPEGSSHEW